MAKESKQRLLHDRAHLVEALRDYQRGKAPPLPDIELAATVTSIERRLEDIESKLKALDLA